MGKQDNLISSALAHDDRAVFDRLFEMLYPKVKYFVLGMCHDEDEAENLTQDIFLKLWTKRHLHRCPPRDAQLHPPLPDSYDDAHRQRSRQP